MLTLAAETTKATVKTTAAEIKKTTKTTKKSKYNAPKTGVAGTAIPLTVMLAAAGLALAVRSKKKDD